MSKSTILAALSFFMISYSSSVLAVEMNKVKMPKYFGPIDANHDKRISRDEFLESQNKQFSNMDINHDGFLDKLDRKKDNEKKGAFSGQGLFDQLDSNGDGIISKREYKSVMDKMKAGM